MNMKNEIKKESELHILLKITEAHLHNIKADELLREYRELAKRNGMKICHLFYAALREFMDNLKKIKEGENKE